MREGSFLSSIQPHKASRRVGVMLVDIVLDFVRELLRGFVETLLPLDSEPQRGAMSIS